MKRISRLEQEAFKSYTPCGNGNMVWRSWGKGKPVIFLHGGYGSWLHWINTVEELKNKFCVYAPDLPGLGESDLPDEPFGPTEIAKAIEQGIVQLFAETEALDVVAFSFGALVSGYLANLIPLRSLTLVAPSGLGLPRQNLTLQKEGKDATPEQRRKIHFTNLSQLMLADKNKIDEFVMHMQEKNVSLARIKSHRFSLSNQLSEALETIKVKRLNFIWGELDSTVGPHMQSRKEYFEKQKKPGIFCIIPKSGHWVSYEQSDLFNITLKSILER